MEKLLNVEGSLSIIKSEIINEFGNKVKNAVLYGTANSDDHNIDSDFDVLLGFENIDCEVLKSIKKVKLKCQDLGIKIDFNSHSDIELPKKSTTDFWHNNRGALFHAEIGKIGKSLISNNPYIENFPTEEAIKNDVIRSLSSLVYRMRKIYSNFELDKEQRYTFVKWSIYAASSALAYNGYFLKSKNDIVVLFEKEFPDLGSIRHFLPYKLNKNLEIPDSIIEEILVFTERLSSYFLKINKQVNGESK